MSSDGSGNIAASKLASMYPTPPSHDNPFSTGSVGPGSAAALMAAQPSPAMEGIKHYPTGGPNAQPLHLHPSEEEVARQRQVAILQSMLSTSRPLFDQEAVCFPRVSWRSFESSTFTFFV